MKIDEAIEILTHYDTDLDAWNDEDNDAAIKLGIEALSFIRTMRLAPGPFEIPILHGETKE